MAQLAGGTRRQHASRRRVATARDQHVRDLDERLDVDPGASRGDAEVDVDLRRAEISERQQRVVADDPQVRARQLSRDRRGEPWAPRELADIGDGEREHARAARGIERRGREQPRELAHGAREHRRELERARRGDDAAALAQHERIAERVAQAGERVADRRLRDPETLRGTRHVELVEHHVQHMKEVEIDRGDAHAR